MILLTLYATGATLGEVSRLRGEDADLSAGFLNLRATQFKRHRTIPLQDELRAALASHIATLKVLPGGWLFRSVNGTSIDRHNLHTSFQRLHASLKIKASVEGRLPRLQDLRFTFAVHRLADAVKRKEKLSELIPALSTYMGYASLTKAEEFLAYVPERFAKDLRSLCPLSSFKHWRESPELLTFLQTI
jgi:integrase/recombinase XerD